VPGFASSRDLRPRHGARFVFTRSEAGYAVVIHLPDRELRTRLWWDDHGDSRLDPEPAVGWVREEAHKLARVLHRDPRATMTRWRGEPGAR
jgi:hypothetical protein